MVETVVKRVMQAIKANNGVAVHAPTRVKYWAGRDPAVRMLVMLISETLEKPTTFPSDINHSGQAGIQES